MNKPNNITVKNPTAMSLPDITVTMELNGTLYRFRGIYDGERALPSKMLQLMENDDNFEKGADKTNDKR